VIKAIVATMVALTFAVGNTIKGLVESVVFLFVTHPFDVGDKVRVDNERYTVVECHLTSIVLRDTQKHKIWYPSKTMLSKPIVSSSFEKINKFNELDKHWSFLGHGHVDETASRIRYSH
jgi:small-conductance mechanosensitive channel